jgi:four helix bundle protein
MLSYEKLDVYQLSIEFLALSNNIVDSFPKGNSFLADQLKRAALSIPLNIAEGCGKTGEADKQRFYAIARGSAMECGAILDACKVLKTSNDSYIKNGKNLVVRIVSMLTKMCNRTSP